MFEWVSNLWENFKDSQLVEEVGEFFIGEKESMSSEEWNRRSQELLGNVIRPFQMLGTPGRFISENLAAGNVFLNYLRTNPEEYFGNFSKMWEDYFKARDAAIGNRDGLEWYEEGSNKITFGQAFQGVFDPGLDFENMTEQDRVNYFDDGMAKWFSGTSDFISLFATDPFTYVTGGTIAAVKSGAIGGMKAAAVGGLQAGMQAVRPAALQGLLKRKVSEIIRRGNKKGLSQEQILTAISSSRTIQRLSADLGDPQMMWLGGRDGSLGDWLNPKPQPKAEIRKPNLITTRIVDGSDEFDLFVDPSTNKTWTFPAGTVKYEDGYFIVQNPKIFLIPDAQPGRWQKNTLRQPIDLWTPEGEFVPQSILDKVKRIPFESLSMFDVPMPGERELLNSTIRQFIDETTDHLRMVAGEKENYIVAGSEEYLDLVTQLVPYGKPFSQLSDETKELMPIGEDLLGSDLGIVYFENGFDIYRTNGNSLEMLKPELRLQNGTILPAKFVTVKTLPRIDVRTLKESPTDSYRTRMDDVREDAVLLWDKDFALLTPEQRTSNAATAYWTVSFGFVTPAQKSGLHSIKIIDRNLLEGKSKRKVRTEVRDVTASRDLQGIPYNLTDEQITQYTDFYNERLQRIITKLEERSKNENWPEGKLDQEIEKATTNNQKLIENLTTRKPAQVTAIDNVYQSINYDFPEFSEFPSGTIFAIARVNRNGNSIPLHLAIVPAEGNIPPRIFYLSSYRRTLNQDYEGTGFAPKMSDDLTDEEIDNLIRENNISFNPDDANYILNSGNPDIVSQITRNLFVRGIEKLTPEQELFIRTKDLEEILKERGVTSLSVLKTADNPEDVLYLDNFTGEIVQQNDENFYEYFIQDDTGLEFADEMESAFYNEEIGMTVTKPQEKRVTKSDQSTPVWIEAMGLNKEDFLGFEYPFINQYVDGKWDSFFVPQGYKLVNIDDVVNKGAWPIFSGPRKKVKYTLDPLTKKIIPAYKLKNVLQAMEIRGLELNLLLKKKLEKAKIEKLRTGEWAPENKLSDSRQVGYGEDSRIIDYMDSDFVDSDPVIMTLWFDITEELIDGKLFRKIQLKRDFQLGIRDEFGNFSPKGERLQEEVLDEWLLDSEQFNRIFNTESYKRNQVTTKSPIGYSLASKAPRRITQTKTWDKSKKIHKVEDLAEAIDAKPLQIFIDQLPSFGKPKFGSQEIGLPGIAPGLSSAGIAPVKQARVVTSPEDGSILFQQVIYHHRLLLSAQARGNKKEIAFRETALDKAIDEYTRNALYGQEMMGSVPDININGLNLPGDPGLISTVDILEPSLMEQAATDWIKILKKIDDPTFDEDTFDIVQYLSKGIEGILSGQYPRMKSLEQLEEESLAPFLAETKADLDARGMPSFLDESVEEVLSTGSVVTRSNPQAFQEALDAGAIYIGRPGQGKTGVFGNPYMVREGERTVEEAVALYRKDLLEMLGYSPLSKDNKLVEYLKRQGVNGIEDFKARLAQLKGKVLACPGNELAEECHGSILLKAIELINPTKKTGQIAKTSNVDTTVRPAAVPTVSDVIIHSGAAEGADTDWARIAGGLGITTKAHSFTGHLKSRRRPIKGEEVVIHTPEELAIADKELALVNKKHIGRTYPPRDLTARNLLRRNYYQVKDSEAIVAITTIGDDGIVEGGTAWAVYLGVEKEIPVHVFDIAKNEWYLWKDGSFVLSTMPPPYKSFAGIGTRKINGNGRKAIREYLEQYGSKVEDVVPTTKVEKSTVPAIDSFKGEYDWLSNFYPARIVDYEAEDIIYPTVEHAFQAYKFKDIETRRRIAAAKTPAEARSIGKKSFGMREDWNEFPDRGLLAKGGRGGPTKVRLMLYLLKEKFDNNPELRQKLIDTGDAELIEGNTWGDTFWGVSKGKGQNQLGKLLMKLRDEYRGNQ